MGLFYFMLFAAVLVVMYISIRRRLAPPGLTAGVGVVGSIVTMTLYLLSDEEVSNVHGIVVGFLLGALFAGAALAIAWYFHSAELREEYAKREGLPPKDNPLGDYRPPEEASGEGDEYYE